MVEHLKCALNDLAQNIRLFHKGSQKKILVYLSSMGLYHKTFYGRI
jgi:hypothetical protein